MPKRTILTPRRTRLTQKTVEATKPESKEFVLWDDALRGFGLRVRPSGHKTYIAKYRVKNARPAQRKTVLGTPSLMSCTSARDRAQTLMAEARLGIDGAASGHISKDAPITLSDFWVQYDRDHISTHKKSTSAAEDRRLAGFFILPSLGDRPLCQIDVTDIRKLHADLRDTPAQANRVLALLSALLNKAMRWDVIPDRPNPCRLVDKYKESPSERFLSAHEARRLATVLDRYECLNPIFVNAIRLILFTGMRKSEALTLKWSEVDLDGERLNLADSKTGKKSIPLNPHALDLLRGLSETRDSKTLDHHPYVFPGCDSVTGDRSSHAVGLQKFWERVRRDADLIDVRIHDLRHSFASFAAEDGVSLVMIGALLGHKDVRSTARYAHLADNALRDATTQTGNVISRAMGDVENQPNDKAA